MNKLVIPTILIGTILIAGIFAFIPVQNAVTVHQEIIAALNGGFADILFDLSGVHGWVTGGHDDLSGQHDEITGLLTNSMQPQILLFSMVVGGSSDFADELPLTPFVIDGYSGEVNILGTTPTNDGTQNCGWNFRIEADTDDNGTPDETVASISVSNTSDFATADISPGTDQLFLDSDDDDSGDYCSIAVSIFLDAVP